MRKAMSLKPVAEWIGGTVHLAAYVTGEGEEPYRPETLVWMRTDGCVLGMMAMKPGELAARVADHFRETARKPMVGTPHMPSRVRVASEQLAATLRRELGARTEIICAPTPEIDQMAAALREHLENGCPGETQTYLTAGITPEAVASLFRSAARLFVAAPWKVVPSDESLFSVTIDELGVSHAALSIIGQAGKSFGFVLFPNHDAYELFRDAGSLIEAGYDPPAIPPYFALDFERGADTHPDLRKEIAAHGWEVAGPCAYPSLLAVDEDGVPRPPTAREIVLAEGIAAALVELMESEPELGHAWRRGKGLTRQITVPTHAGPIHVTLSAPYDAKPSRESGGSLAARTAKATAGRRFNIHDEVRDADGDLDEGWFESFVDNLIEQFAMSPECETLGPVIFWSQLLMDFGKDYQDVTIAQMSAADFKEIVFELFPRKILDASVAPSIVAELRAFWTFLQREFRLPNARACLDILHADAAEQLEHAFSNSADFGMAKSFVMAGDKAGFDMSSGEILSRPTRSADERRIKRNKRKAQRASRKKNR